MKIKSYTFLLLALCLAVPSLLLLGCEREEREDEEESEGYVPSIGEIMILNQNRHNKLWLAGNAGNWPLASFEVHELEEGFETIVELHPVHEYSEVPLTELVPKMIDRPIKMVEEAIEAQDSAAFVVAYDSLTVACNSCHQALNYGFNVIVRPSSSNNPFPNQDFSVPK